MEGGNEIPSSGLIGLPNLFDLNPTYGVELGGGLALDDVPSRGHTWCDFHRMNLKGGAPGVYMPPNPVPSLDESLEGTDGERSSEPDTPLTPVGRLDKLDIFASPPFSVPGVDIPVDRDADYLKILPSSAIPVAPKSSQADAPESHPASFWEPPEQAFEWAPDSSVNQTPKGDEGMTDAHKAKLTYNKLAQAKCRAKKKATTDRLKRFNACYDALNVHHLLLNVILQDARRQLGIDDSL